MPPAQVRVIVLDNVMLKPGYDVYILVNTSITYSVVRLRQGRVTGVFHCVPLFYCVSFDDSRHLLKRHKSASFIHYLFHYCNSDRIWVDPLCSVEFISTLQYFTILLLSQKLKNLTKSKRYVHDCTNSLFTPTWKVTPEKKG